MTNGQNAARSRHLEELANAAKRYTLREILDVTEAVAAELEDFTGATSIASGISGLVPAPQAGDENKFLRGDGVWATVESGSSSGDVRFLDTVPSAVDGGFWYEVENGVPLLCLHKGRYDYKYSHAKIRLTGDTSDALVAYLPFNNSPTADACGNVWTPTGNPTIVDGALYLDGTSYLSCSSIASLSSSQTWTIDMWATLEADDWFHYFFGMDNIGGLYDYTGHNTWYVKSTVVTSTDLSLNTRHHIAVCCDANGIRLFVDGVKTYEKTDTTWEFTSPVYIGAGTNGGFPMKGKLEKLRIFNQIIWDTDFTPPTAEDYL